METLNQYEARIANMSNDDLSKLMTVVLNDRNEVFVSDGSFAERKRIAIAEFHKRFVETLTIVG